MFVTDLFFPFLVCVAAFWTYSHQQATPPTGEIICMFAVVVLLTGFIWFVAIAPWFLNLGLLLVLRITSR